MLLDIIILFFLCRALGNKLREKGRTPIGYQVSLVLLWFGAEFVTGFVWGMMSVLQNGGQDVEIGIAARVTGVAAAAVSAGVMFLIVHLLPSLNHLSHHKPFGQPDSYGANQPPPAPNSSNPFEPPRQ